MDFSNLSFRSTPLIKSIPPGPESKKLIDFQSLYEGASVSYPKGLPIAIKQAKGATIEDVDGNLYIDFFAGAGVMAVGHSNPIVVDKVKQQLDMFTHTLDLPNPVRKQLVERLVSILPNGLNKIFFGGPTGSDAIEAAMKLAKLNTGRFNFIAFEGGYHGMTSGALSLTSHKYHRNGLLPLLPGIHFLPYAYCYRCPLGHEKKTCNLACATYLEHILESPHSGIDQPAGIVIEAIQGEGGTIVPPEGYLEKLREICDRHGLLMIVDEIQTGFCRTGKMFAFEYSKILPDIVVMSKALGGIGLPISGIAYQKKYDIWTPGVHIGTFRGNALAYAGGSAGIDFMIKENLAEHSSKLGNMILEGIQGHQEESNLMGDVRGRGLMIGIELVEDKVSKKPSPEYAKKIRKECLQNGLIVEIGGHYSNVIRFLPPLIITESLAKKGVDIFLQAVDKVESNT